MRSEKDIGWVVNKFKNSSSTKTWDRWLKKIMISKGDNFRKSQLQSIRNVLETYQEVFETISSHNHDCQKYYQYVPSQLQGMRYFYDQVNQSVEYNWNKKLEGSQKANFWIKLLYYFKSTLSKEESLLKKNNSQETKISAQAFRKQKEENDLTWVINQIQRKQNQFDPTGSHLIRKTYQSKQFETTQLERMISIIQIYEEVFEEIFSHTHDSKKQFIHVPNQLQDLRYFYGEVCHHVGSYWIKKQNDNPKASFWTKLLSYMKELCSSDEEYQKNSTSYQFQQIKNYLMEFQKGNITKAQKYLKTFETNEQFFDLFTMILSNYKCLLEAKKIISQLNYSQQKRENVGEIISQLKKLKEKNQEQKNKVALIQQQKVLQERVLEEERKFVSLLQKTKFEKEQIVKIEKEKNESQRQLIYIKNQSQIIQQNLKNHQKQIEKREEDIKRKSMQIQCIQEKIIKKQEIEKKLKEICDQKNFQQQKLNSLKKMIQEQEKKIDKKAREIESLQKNLNIKQKSLKFKIKQIEKEYLLKFQQLKQLKNISLQAETKSFNQKSKSFNQKQIQNEITKLKDREKAIDSNEKCLKEKYQIFERQFLQKSQKLDDREIKITTIENFMLKQLQKSKMIHDFDGYIYRQNAEKVFLLQNIKKFNAKNIVKQAKILFSFPRQDSKDFHESVDGYSNYVILILLKNQMKIAVYSQKPLNKYVENVGSGFLCSLTNKEAFYLKQTDKAIFTTYDEDFLRFGKSELLIELREMKVKSYFGERQINSFDSRKHKTSKVILGQNQKEVPIIGLEVFQIKFDF